MSSLKTDLTPPDQSGDSETRSMAAPAVAPAAERPAVHDPPDPSSAERLLTEMVRQARAAHDEATARFQEINEANPGGSPRPELTARLQEAAATQRSARAALAKALDQLNDFLLYGIIPETSAPAANRDRERELEAALFGLYKAWARLPVPPNRLRPFFAEKFRQMIVPGCKLYKRGPEAVRHILYRSKTNVLAHLVENQRLDLSVEALVLSGEWDDLFNAKDRKVAAEKLEEAAQTEGHPEKSADQRTDKAQSANAHSA